MGLRQRLEQLAAWAVAGAGQAAAATARGTVAVVTSKAFLWTAKTAGKAFIVGAGTAAGMAIGGPVGAAVGATISGSAITAGSGGAVGSHHA